MRAKMKTSLLGLTSILVLGFSGQAHAAPEKVNAVSKKKLSRDIRFNGSQVDGKYLSAGESVAEVEGEKEMGALIGIRKNFRDRLRAENERLQANQGASSAGKGQ